MTLFTPDTQLGDTQIDIEKLNLPPTRAEFVEFQRIARRAKTSEYIALATAIVLLARIPNVGVMQIVSAVVLSFVVMSTVAHFVWGPCTCPRCGARVGGTFTPADPFTRRPRLPSNWSEAVRAIGPKLWIDQLLFRRCRSCLTRLNWSEADIRER